MSPAVHELLEIRNVSKRFPGVVALDEVSITVSRGSVHALMGENGAGKSTLMKILSGMYMPDEGDILIEGGKVVFSGVRDAMKAGISMIHQELMPIPELTVAENIFLGKEPVMGRTGLVDFREMNRQAMKILERIQLDIPADRRMKDLPIAQMQMIEIAKAISNDARVIIMDEPTSAITSREVDILFGIIAQLKREGISVIYISHKMDEIFRISDVITVMRDGRVVGTRDAAELDHDQLISMMVGRSLNTLFQREHPAVPGECLVRVESLTGRGFHDIGFSLHAGEVLGFAGLMGSGRSEMANAVYGLDKPDSGSVIIDGSPKDIRSPRDAIDNGIAFVTEDRKMNGLVLTSSVTENMTLSSLSGISNWNFVDKELESGIVREQIVRYRIVVPDEHSVVLNLSGGNQQKIVIAKALLTKPRILILDEPTRGIDIGAKAEIYRMIRELSDGGMGIILISSELSEIIGICDRVLVLNKGGIAAELTGEGMNEEEILRHAMN
jgi:inositol transport system ATP-binding protein